MHIAELLVYIQGCMQRSSISYLNSKALRTLLLLPLRYNSYPSQTSMYIVLESSILKNSVTQIRVISSGKPHSCSQAVHTLNTCNL